MLGGGVGRVRWVGREEVGEDEGKKLRVYYLGEGEVEFEGKV